MSIMDPDCESPFDVRAEGVWLREAGTLLECGARVRALVDGQWRSGTLQMWEHPPVVNLDNRLGMVPLHEHAVCPSYVKQLEALQPGQGAAAAYSSPTTMLPGGAGPLPGTCPDGWLQRDEERHCWTLAGRELERDANLQFELLEDTWVSARAEGESLRLFLRPNAREAEVRVAMSSVALQSPRFLRWPMEAV